VRVIFLDIDGVLNSEAFLLTLDAQHRGLGPHEGCECYRLERQIDHRAVARLNHLITETAAKIVISSSWRRLLDPPELRRVLGDHGLVGEIIGETPNLSEDPALYRIRRGHEIDAWLRDHPEVDCFVILDDGGDMAMHMNRLVQTDAQEGLRDEDVDLAIRVMRWDGTSVLVEKHTWPCPGKPERMIGQPLGMYHCEYCGEMQIAGVSHLPPQFPSRWEEPFPKIEDPDEEPFPKIEEPDEES
jgi:HAD domain in Swiss Army Knife RNA repair proteins